MFTSVVQCINEAIEIKRTSVVTTGRQTVIGVLDIYGFEIFDNNRYKQPNKRPLYRLFSTTTLASRHQKG